MLLKQIKQKIASAQSVYRARGWHQLRNAFFRDIYALVLRWVGQRFVTRSIFDFKMILDLDDPGISRALWLYGSRELDHRYMLKNVVDRGSTILDIGANIGYYVLTEAQLIGSNGKILAFEPSPSNVELLRKNIALNNLSGVEVTEAAVSDTSGESALFLSKESNLNSLHGDAVLSPKHVQQAISVKIIDVFEILEAETTIDLIRMDIEGHEVSVLNRVADFVERSKKGPTIIFETHQRAYSQANDITTPIGRLLDLGYDAKMVSSSNEQGTEILERLGALVETKIKTDDYIRSMHVGVSNRLLLDCLGGYGGIRTVCLEKQ